MAMFCTFLLLLLYSSLIVQGENVIKIFREKAHPDDDILLERNSAECPKTGAAYTPACDTFNGASLGGCWCHCGRPNEKRTFFEPNNECVAVSTARQQSGCDLLITDETYDGPLEFFPLPGATATEKTVNVPENRTCSVYFNESLYVQYLACDGTWQQVPSQLALANFEVTPGWSSSSLVIRSKPGSTVLANNKGRIFRVAIQCRSQHESNVPANSSTCAMFKVQGSTFCPFPRPTPQTGGISVSLPPPISGTIIPATGTLAPLLTVKEKTTMQTPSKATEEPATKTTGRPETTESGNSEVTENPGVLGDTGATKTSKKNTFIIAGAVAGGVLLMALVLLILWRCNNPKKRGHPHSRLEGSISSPISQMSRHSIPVYTDAAQFSHMGAMGAYGMRTSSMDNSTYRRGSDGIILGPDFKRGSLYPEVYPTSAPPRPPGVKRSSINGHVNPGLTLREEIVTMNPLFEGQVIEHKDLDPLNCSEFGLYPDQIVMEDRKNPEAFNETTYDCPEEILKGKHMTSTPVPVYYVVDDPYPDSISNTFGYDRGRPDGHVFDEPERDLGRRPYVVMDNPNAVAYTLDYDGLPREGQLGARRQSSPNHGILKAGSMSPTNQRYPSQSDYDDGHTQVI